MWLESALDGGGFGVEGKVEGRMGMGGEEEVRVWGAGAEG